NRHPGAIQMLNAAIMALLLLFGADPAETGTAPAGPVAYTEILAEEEAGRARAAAEAEAFANEAPDWRLSARLYHAGGGGATGNDSLGCPPVAMRTVATDPRVVP